MICKEKKVPIYEYICKGCGNSFEKIVFASDDENTLECPACGKKNLSKIVSAFSRGNSVSGGKLTNSISGGCSPSGGFS